MAQSTTRAFAFDLANGTLRWAEMPGELGTLGAVRVADLDEDRASEILVIECACCQINNGETGYAYSFSGGFAAPARLWRFPSAYCPSRNASGDWASRLSLSWRE